ncbi:MAG: hypothetical protein AAGH40_02965 [Verrucomicrobiota bacterium]
MKIPRSAWKYPIRQDGDRLDYLLFYPELHRFMTLREINPDKYIVLAGWYHDSGDGVFRFTYPEWNNWLEENYRLLGDILQWVTPNAAFDCTRIENEGIPKELNPLILKGHKRLDESKPIELTKSNKTG